MPDGLVPFSDVSGFAVAGIVAVYFLSYFIRGTLGFGSSMPAVLGGAWVLPPHDAVLLALLTALFAQVQLLPQGFREANWRVARPMIAGMVLSVMAGVWIFASLKAAWLTIVLGACLSLAVVVDIGGLAERASKYTRLDRAPVAFGLSAAAGLLAAVAGAGANYFLSFYLRWATPDPRAFRATNIILSGATVLWRSVVTLALGLLGLKLAIEAALLMPAVYAGGWAGRHFAMRVPTKRFFGLFRVLLLAAAVALIWKGMAALPK